MNKSELDIEETKRKLRKGLRQDLYKMTREWPYKNVPRKILAEKYMTDESGTELKDYKVFNFNGVPEIIQVDYGRFTNHYRNVYNTNWEFVKLEWECPCDESLEIKRPEALDEMLELARTLSKGLPHLRTDFYVIGKKKYWGELTFFHDSGMCPFKPEIWDERLGNLIKLPEKIERR